MSINRWAFVAIALLAQVGLSLAADAPRPNIVFVLADDLGWTDLGCQGSGYYETPHIDRLAADGMRFTQGYTCGPNCQPTRAALLSGQYGPRTGIYTVGSTDRFDTTKRPLVPVDNTVDLALGKVTFAEMLQQAGYATGMFGKWHLGKDAEFHPSQQGFSEALVSTKHRHFEFATEPPVDVPPKKYLADFLTDRAVDFIERHEDEPFLLYVPHFGVHSPYQAKRKQIRRFEDKSPDDGHDDPTYAAMVASVDDSVGRIVKKLDELNLSEQTLVIFSSDNGGVGGYRAEGVDARDVTSNKPLRGGKGMLYEGGVRVPFIFRWPGHIEAGTESDEPIISVDLWPTFAELAAASSPPASQPLDGKSLLPLLDGRQNTLTRDALYWHFPGYLGSANDTWRTTPVSMIREGDYKLLEFFEDGHVELYDVQKDLEQEHDLAAAEPELAQRLRTRLEAWRTEVGAPIPAKRADR